MVRKDMLVSIKASLVQIQITKVLSPIITFTDHQSEKRVYIASKSQVLDILLWRGRGGLERARVILG
jgi:hypothetical protein